MSNKQSSLAWDVDGLTLAQKIVLVKMADEANDDGMIVHYRRSQSYLAGRTGAHVQTVRAVIGWLEEHGFLDVMERGTGRAQAKYRLTIRRGMELSGQLDADPESQSVEGKSDVEGQSDATPHPPTQGVEGKSDATPELASASAQGASQAVPHHPTPIPLLSQEHARPSDVDEFDEFWRTYPRRKEPKRARTAWDRAIKRGTDPADIIEGARRYAAEKASTEPRFVKHPATWLNGGCWDDEPDKPARRQGRARQHDPHHGPEGIIAV